MSATVAQRTQARDAILHWHRDLRPTRPRCGAKRKHDGQPCQQLALGNGRCAYHGGRTPSGKGWHKPRWPKADTPNAEAALNRKLRDLAKAARKRERRLASMTPEERAEHEAWHAARKPGSPADRAERRRQRQQAIDMRKLLAAPATATPAADDLQRQIDELKARMLDLDRPPAHDIFS